jgi:hypothetical protein
LARPIRDFSVGGFGAWASFPKIAVSAKTFRERSYWDYRHSGIEHARCRRRSETIMMHRYSTAILSGALGLALAFGFIPRAESKNKTGAKITGQTMSATGCLTKDPKEKNEYLVTGADGKTWGLRSNTVKLTEHLNHKVTVTGKVTKGEHGNEAGDMEVSELKMISESCK